MAVGGDFNEDHIGRASLVAVSNRYGLVFVGIDTGKMWPYLRQKVPDISKAFKGSLKCIDLFVGVSFFGQAKTKNKFVSSVITVGDSCQTKSLFLTLCL